MNQSGAFWARIAISACLLAANLPVQGASGHGWTATDFKDPDFFPILPWDPLEGWDGKRTDYEVNGLESLVACHFNMAGFVRPKDLPRCRKLGLGAILLPSGGGVLPLKYQREWKHLSDEEIDRRVKAMVKAGGANPALCGYFIMDEPGVADFPALGKAVAAVAKYAPGKLAYINLFPDYATLGAPDMSQLGTTNYTEYLEQFVKVVRPQLISYDNYTVQYSDDLKNMARGASYFKNLLEIRRVAQSHQLPYLNIVAANQLRPGHAVPTPANLLLQAYTTLAAGYRGVTWYTYFGRGYRYAPIDAAGNRTLTWSYLSEVNRQVAALAPVLRRLSSTGVYFSSPAPAEGLPALPGDLIQSIASTAPIMAGEFTEGYFLLVNISLERSANLSLSLKRSGTLEQVSAVDGRQRPLSRGQDGVWLGPGQGVLLRSLAGAKSEPANQKSGRSAAG